VSFSYEKSWLQSSASHSLSLSMPLPGNTYSQKLVLPYLWNLLPENPNVLQRWAQEYHVSASNPFRMLGYVGADVPGAAQFIPEDRLDELRLPQRTRIEWISIADLTERLKQLRKDISAFRRPTDRGKISLPGAQAKTAFYWDEATGRWGVPMGRTPTTHIVKPCVPEFDGLVENEHLCQDIAARMNLPAARSQVLALDETCIVVERYDRLPDSNTASRMIRVHQEDMCQSLGLMPAKKYQEEGGPGIATIVALIRRVSSDPETDVNRFIEANVFNWLIGGTDAHAKNYSLLIGAGDQVRLAPLYDLSSQLPYEDRIEQNLAMKIGDHYKIARIGLDDWRILATAIGMDTDRILDMLKALLKKMPDAISGARDQALSDGLDKKVITKLAALLHENVSKRAATIETIRYPRTAATPRRT